MNQKLKFKLKLDLHFSLRLAAFPNTYISLRSRYACSLCHLVVVIGIASALTSRTKTPGSSKIFWNT